MKIFIKYILFVSICGNAFSHLKAQTAENTSIVYDQFFQNYFLLNPASHDSLEKIRISIGNRTLTGLFEGVNRTYLDGSFKINHFSKDRFSRIGLLLMNNKEGEFINNAKAYFRYSWTTGLGPNSSISAGIALGIINSSVQASDAGGGSSAFSFDGNLGVWYLRKKLSVGLAYLQMNPRIPSILNPKIPLSPYYNLNFIYKTELRYNLILTSHLHFKYNVFQSHYINIDVAPIFLFSNKFETGINYRHGRGVSLIAGLRAIPIGKGAMRFMASYLLGTRNLSNTADNVLEFSVGYGF